MSYIVIGNSAAGLFAVEEIRRHDTLSEIIVLTAEQEQSYSRCLTTYFLAGDIPASRLYLREEGFAERLKLKVIYGVEVNWIDPVRRLVRSTDGQEWGYSKLLLAMGASANKLLIKGGNLPEVFTLRTMKDALDINQVLERGAQKAVVIGGGLVSLKSAYALKKRGLQVTVLVSSGQILSQMLDEKAASIIQGHLAANGLRFLLQTEAEAITGEEQLQGVLIAPHTELVADLVIVGKGVRPNLGELRTIGFNIGMGLQVDSSLATNLPNIYAAGDIAETWDLVRQKFTVNATWPNATAQGRIAGANMCGGQEIYPGSLGLNSVDFFGLSAMSAGITKLPEKKGQGDWDQEKSLKMVGDMPIYRNLLWQGDILKGFVLVGDTSQCGVLTSLVKTGRPLTQAQKNLTMGKRGTLAVGMMN
ncbi:NAD(P)/FAD-dependent oxidoreductase [Desulfosporosinus sp. BICA1-9]|uniref:NAD(P)/FAD-dependent oxidoreductase n=1 Tax=Desulfosporosinus sp. BICA1-9 TaxID=1531958 RepID=UPI00054B4895|nr:FAD-dependent oxidoreductase [Desulfosporosinus sp. BICA1-9]KJS50766.1 MAG: pyridine nucleotide-disulfide oxidoreductase [Peptococcaceae bacterium BRH_c23]KJS90372.1 MAG: pyridine nucleotide-disulfide oxidoreductase [Desulfosporosinus sp. BICA1-9]HBW38357.1 NAD(P)/FAD-dependent oxidoreductase [Desulfosporosinus sp.]